jgi:hypothetical protein
MDHIAPLFVLGLACALIGWAMIVLTSRFERERRERHPELFSEHRVVESTGPTLPPPWIRFLGRWLLPER